MNSYWVRRCGEIALIVVTLAWLTACQSLQGNNNQGGGGSVTLAQGSLNFGTVMVGSKKTLQDTVTNSTSSSVTISSISGANQTFVFSGVTLPVTLTAGQSAPFSVQFQPVQVGNPSTTLSLVGPDGTTLASLPALGNAIAQGQLTADPPSVDFGNVKVGRNNSSTITLNNVGGTDVTLTAATLSGAGFTMGNLVLPVTIPSGGSTNASVTFAPTGGGTFSGTVTFTSDGGSVIVPLSGTGVTPGTLSASPTSLAFNNVQVGKSANLTETLTNTGGTSVTISQANVSGSGFSISGLSLPATVTAGRSVSLTATFTPSAAGTVSGTLAIVSDETNSPLNIPLSGTGFTPGALTANPTSVAFGNVKTGSNQSTPITITNTGGSNVKISSASVSGTGFSFTGPTLPVTLNAGQTATFNAVFAPTVTGTSNGTLTINSNANNPTLTVPLSGTGVTPGQLTPNPTSLSFGSVTVGQSKTLPETLSNSGGSSLTISAASASGTGFSISGLTLPLTLTPGQNTTFSVKFSPSASGGASGSVSITSDGQNPNLSIALSGTGATAGTLSANPTSLPFGNVQVGKNASLSETLTNTGGSNVTISAANITGTGFSVSGLTLPDTLTPGGSVTFTVTFAPAAAGTASGTLAMVSNASNSPLNIGLSGTGTAQGTLSVSPTTLAFGNVVVGQNKSLNGTLSAAGASVTVTAASLGGTNKSEFALSGISFPVTINAGNSASFTITFTPGAAGSASASASFTSNASNSPTAETLTGTGTAAQPHSVDLSWTASVSQGVAGYNIYRGTVTGGPYTQINGSPISGTAYTDNAVSAGQTYYYVATAVDGNGLESGYSNQTQAIVPTP